MKGEGGDFGIAQRVASQHVEAHVGARLATAPAPLGGAHARRVSRGDGLSSL